MANWMWFMVVLLLMATGRSIDALTSGLITLSSSSYSAKLGSNLTIACLALNIPTIDITWYFYPLDNDTNSSLIYANAELKPWALGSFVVTTYQTAYSEVKSELTIIGFNQNHTRYSYKCSCNIYRSCATGSVYNAAANVSLAGGEPTTSTIISLQTTTTKLHATKLSSFHNDDVDSNAESLVQGVSKTSSTNSQPVQSVLISVTFFLLVLTSLGSVLPFNPNIKDKVLLSLVLLVASACLIVGFVFMINPTVSPYLTSASSFLITVASFLLACLLLWTLIVFFVIKIGLKGETSLSLVVLVCFLAISEFGAAFVIVCSDFLLQNHQLAQFSAVLFLLFAFFLSILIAITSLGKRKKINQDIFSSLPSETPAIVTNELLFSNKSLASLSREDSFLPSRPATTRLIEFFTGNSREETSTEIPTKKKTSSLSGKKLKKKKEVSENDQVQSNQDVQKETPSKKSEMKRKKSLTTESESTNVNSNSTRENAAFSYLWNAEDTIMPKAEDDPVQFLATACSSNQMEEVEATSGEKTMSKTTTKSPKKVKTTLSKRTTRSSSLNSTSFNVENANETPTTSNATGGRSSRTSLLNPRNLFQAGKSRFSSANKQAQKLRSESSMSRTRKSALTPSNNSAFNDEND